ncbi:MAG: hypothetical protein R3F14_45510 [Polyangiaceae bacterium]
MNPPPILNTPPPRDPAGMAGLFESRVPLGIKMLVGIWGFVLALVGLMTLRGYLKYGEVDVAVAGVIGGVVGVALSAAVVIGLVMAQGRATRLYTHGLGCRFLCCIRRMSMPCSGPMCTTWGWCWGSGGAERGARGSGGEGVSGAVRRRT